MFMAVLPGRQLTFDLEGDGRWWLPLFMEMYDMTMT
jgi:hypothetical protein